MAPGVQKQSMLTARLASLHVRTGRNQRKSTSGKASSLNRAGRGGSLPNTNRMLLARHGAHKNHKKSARRDLLSACQRVREGELRASAKMFRSSPCLLRASKGAEDSLAKYNLTTVGEGSFPTSTRTKRSAPSSAD